MCIIWIRTIKYVYVEPRQFLLSNFRLDDAIRAGKAKQLTMTKHVETNPATEIRNTYPPAKRCTALFVLVCDAIIVHCLEKQLNQDIYINLTKHFTEKSPGNKYTLTTDLHLQLNICWFKRVGCCVTADWILIGRCIKWVKWLFQTDIDIEVEGLRAQA